MKLRPSFMVIPFLLGVLLTVCCSRKNSFAQEKLKIPDDSAAIFRDHADKFMILSNLFNSKDTSLGQEVDYTNAKLCMDIFREQMDKHGFKPDVGPLVIRVRRARKITESEAFQGDRLLEWLIETVKTYDPEGYGKNVLIKVAFGVYTSQFFTNEHVDSALRVLKDDRIGVFLVPYNKTTKQLITTGKVYDLGGLDP